MLVTRYKYTIALFSVPALVSVALAFINRPPAFLESYYQLSSSVAHAVTVGLTFPFIIDLIFVVWAYLGVRRYVETIEGSTEWRAFKLLQHALFSLALVTALFPLSSQAIIYSQTNNVPAVAPLIRISNCLLIVIGLAIGGLLYRSSVQLLGLVAVYDRGGRTTLTLSYLVFAALYVYLTYQSSARLPGNSLSLYGLLYPSVFHLPDWLSCATITAPLLIIWYLFLLAIQNMYIFQMNTKGKFYRVAFQNFPRGLIARVASYVAVRVLAYLPVASGIASFILQFVSITVLLAIGVAGNLLITSGAARLYKVEKV